MFVSALLLSLAVQDTVVVAPPLAKPERKICKAAASTGSRMGATRVCRTASEWKTTQTGGADERYVSDSLNTAGYNAGAIQTTEPTRAIGR